MAIWTTNDFADPANPDITRARKKVSLARAHWVAIASDPQSSRESIEAARVAWVAAWDSWHRLNNQLVKS